MARFELRRRFLDLAGLAKESICEYDPELCPRIPYILTLDLILLASPHLVWTAQ